MVKLLKKALRSLPWNRPAPSREQVIRAKAAMYGARAGSAVRPSDGKVRVEVQDEGKQG